MIKYVLILVTACALPAQADTPLTPATTRMIESANKRFKVVSDPQKGTRCIDQVSSKELWSLPDWYRWSFLCDDGRHYITGYGGLNLIPQDYKGSYVMLTFWKDGKLVRTVTIDELIPDKTILTPTASHYSWGFISGLKENGLLEVILEDKSKHYFDPQTGRRVKPGR